MSDTICEGGPIRIVDLAYEVGWLRGRVEATINYLEREHAGITTQDKIALALAGLRDALDEELLAESLRRLRA